MLAKFQSTPPRRRRQGERVLQYNEDVFNPRLREGGDSDQKQLLDDLYNFSIHASAKEATILSAVFSRQFIFQSTPPRRRRQEQTSIIAGLKFSIHASAKEATRTLLTSISNMANFQSTPPRRRRRLITSKTRADNKVFNPRLREGGDS